MNKKICLVCLVLVDRTNHALVTRRPLNKALAGLWEFPGGKIEEGESPEAALYREIREELKLEVTDLVGLSVVHYVYKSTNLELFPFLSRCANRPFIELVEHIGLRWLSLEEMESLDWAPADIPVLLQLKKLL